MWKERFPPISRPFSKAIMWPLLTNLDLQILEPLLGQIMTFFLDYWMASLSSLQSNKQTLSLLSLLENSRRLWRLLHPPRLQVLMGAPFTIGKPPSSRLLNRLSLGFFHAYDRVSMDWVDRVLEAMGFGLIFRGRIATLLRGASASFHLSNISPVLIILSPSARGDPLAALLFIIYLEPFLVRLEAVLSGLRVANIRDAFFGYMANVQALGDDLQDILRVDLACRDLEAASGALLNRNRKSTIIGLRSWASRQDWPLQWLLASDHVKVLGFTISPVFSQTVQLSWDKLLASMEQTWAVYRRSSWQPSIRSLSSLLPFLWWNASGQIRPGISSGLG